MAEEPKALTQFFDHWYKEVEDEEIDKDGNESKVEDEDIDKDGNESKVEDEDIDKDGNESNSENSSGN